MNRQTLRLAGAAALSATLAVAALAPAAAQDPSALPIPTIPETPTPMEFLYAQAAFYGPFFVAEEKGYFDDYGVDVTLAIKSGTAETTQLLATNQSQAGGSTWGSGFFNSITLNSGVSVVSQLAKVPTATVGKPVSPLIVSKTRFDSGEITTVADLAGKNVGIPGPGGFGEYSVHLALQSGGLSMADVNLVNLGPPDAGLALDNGSVDASFTIEPLASGFAAQDLTASVSDWHAAGVELAFIAFSSEWLEGNTDTVIRFTAAYLKAANELENGGWADPANQAYVAKYTELPVEALASIGLTQASADGTFDEASIRDQEEYYRAAGQLTYEGPADLASVLRPDILAAANAFLAANP